MRSVRSPTSPPPEAGTIVEVTPIGQGRDPDGLRRISEATGVNIVANTGFYIEAGHPAYVAEESVDALADILARDIEHGIGDTGVRAGFMGDVGTARTVTKSEEKCLRAVARAHLRTGVAFGIHVDPSDRGAGDAGHRRSPPRARACPPSAWSWSIWTSSRSTSTNSRSPRPAHIWSSTLGAPSSTTAPHTPYRSRGTSSVPKSVKTLIDHGHVGQLLMAQDVWLRQLMKKYGGEGYDSFFRYGVPRLRRSQAGVTDEQIRVMLVDNPMRLLPLGV